MQIGLEVVALAAGGEADELDRAAGERPGDVAAELEHRVAEVLDQVVVALRPAGGRDVVVAA